MCEGFWGVQPPSVRLTSLGALAGGRRGAPWELCPHWGQHAGPSCGCAGGGGACLLRGRRSVSTCLCDVLGTTSGRCSTAPGPFGEVGGGSLGDELCPKLVREGLKGRGWRSFGMFSQRRPGHAACGGVPSDRGLAGDTHWGVQKARERLTAVAVNQGKWPVWGLLGSIS